MFLTVLFHWTYKMKYSCYQDSSVIHGWFIYWVFGWEMRRLSNYRKSDLGWHRFQKWTYSLHLAWCVKGLKSLKRFWPWWLSLAASGLVSLKIIVFDVFVCFFPSFMKSSVVYAVSLCMFVRFETMIWPRIRFDINLQNFKKPLDIFWPQIERKRSE